MAVVELRPPSQRVSRRAPYLWGAHALLVALVPLLVAVLLAATGAWQPPRWAWPGYVVVAVGYVVGMPVVRYRVHRWEATATAVYTETGWLGRERRIAPMARVQTVDFAQGLLGRLLGLADVTVTTASAAGPLAIAALDTGVALRLVDELTQRAGAGDDAT